jgi:hypothetical protein
MIDISPELRRRIKVAAAHRDLSIIQLMREQRSGYLAQLSSSWPLK